MTLHVLAWVLGGTEATGTAGLGLPWFPESSPTWGLTAEILPGFPQTHGIRFLQFVPLLAEHGVEVRCVPWPAGTSLEERLELAREAIEWADVVQSLVAPFVWVCSDCPIMTSSDADALAHKRSGHRPFPSDLDLRGLWAGARNRKGLGLVVDADDTSRTLPKWWLDEHGATLDRLARDADLLTCSTPVMERWYRQRFNKSTRIVRNAVDVSEFVPDQPRPDGPTRLAWYGTADRERDYTGTPLRPGERASYCRAAVRDHRALLRTVYLGWLPFDPAAAPRLRAAGFDELVPMVDWDKWGVILASAWPEIGVAPLIINDWNSAKSELHWLEFAACGAACVAERFRGGGPYDVIRDGVDGFLARGRQEWSDKIGRLAREPQLRADMAAAAKERVIRDYDPRVRAAEMADAYRWAAEHAGINRGAA